MKLPPIRPLTISAVAVVSALMMYFFPLTIGDKAANEYSFPAHIVIGMTLGARFVSGHFGKPGVSGWFESLWGAVELIFYGGMIAIVIHAGVHSLVEFEWESIGMGVVIALFWAEIGGLLTMLLYLIELTNLMAMAASIAIVHLVAQFDRRRL